MGIFDFLKKKKKTLIVPEGHKVVVLKCCPHPTVIRMECGIWVADFGNTMDYNMFDMVFGKVGAVMEEEKKGSFLWLFQQKALDAQDKQSKRHYVQSRLAWLKEKKGFSHTCIFISEAGKDTQYMQDLKNLDFHVRYSGEDDACFVEVHKPGGEIIVGMVGEEFKGESSSGYTDLDQLIFDIAEHKLESDLETLYQILPEEEFYLPMKMISARKPGEAFKTGQGDQVATSKLPNGMIMVSIYTRTTIMRTSFGGMTGKEALRMILKMDGVDGLIVINKSNSWVGINKAVAADILNGRYAKL